MNAQPAVVTHTDLEALEGRVIDRISDAQHATTRWMIGIGFGIVAIMVGLYGPLIAVLLQVLTRLPR